jgi:hypothetical protein
MDDSALFSAPHRRLNILTGEWLLVSPHCTAHPWLGQVTDAHIEQRRNQRAAQAAAALAGAYDQVDLAAWLEGLADRRTAL